MFDRFNRRAKVENETGLSTISNLNGGRFFKKNGTPNTNLTGIGFWQSINVYHTLLMMPRLKFALVILGFFVLVNLLFAFVYLLIGIDHLGGLVATTPAEKFGEAFFFSAQTFTTVGYGRINPIGFAASVTAAFEALCGLMSFALATGLLYGRFAKPKAYLKYSKHALIAPYKDGVGLMIRFVPYTKNVLVNVEAKITIAIKVFENDNLKNKFFNADLEISKVNTLSSNWTLVHPINENSPLYGYTKEDLKNSHVELLVFIQGFDESFSNTVVSRASYIESEFIYGAKFLPMFESSKDGLQTVIKIDQLDEIELVKLNTEYFK